LTSCSRDIDLSCGLENESLMILVPPVAHRSVSNVRHGA